LPPNSATSVERRACQHDRLRITTVRLRLPTEVPYFCPWCVATATSAGQRNYHRTSTLAPDAPHRCCHTAAAMSGALSVDLSVVIAGLRPGNPSCEDDGCAGQARA